MRLLGPLKSTLNPPLPKKTFSPAQDNSLWQCARSVMSVVAVAGIMWLSPSWLAPAQAESNFGTVRINSSTDETVEGYTAGAVPLFAILNAREDENNEPCVGYAERNPDHIFQVATTLSDVIIEVESNGGDTTLMIETPDHTIYCSDDGNDADAVITGQNWGIGEYKVWVGTFDAGQRYDYTLEINP